MNKRLKFGIGMVGLGMATQTIIFLGLLLGWWK